VDMTDIRNGLSGIQKERDGRDPCPVCGAA
jgi:hypothetical protein